MKVRDLLSKDIDIDVCDDYDESCYIAFCGPIELTDEGEEEFADILDCPITIKPDLSGYGNVALIHAEDDDEVQLLARLFDSAAGYCSESDYERLFIDD